MIARMLLPLATALLLGCDVSPAPNDTPVAASAVDSGHVAVDGGSLYWEAAGAGEPVVLIHGGNLDLPGVGHMINLEAEREFDRAVLEFMRVHTEVPRA